MLTFEEVVQEVRKLGLKDKRRLSEILAEETPKTIEEIAVEQGKGPVNFDDLLKRGEFWPEDESVDELVAFVRESRKGDPYKRLSRLED